MKQLALLFAVLFLGGCGAATTVAGANAAPFTAETRALFEDGVDFVADPGVLDGQWRENWARELDERVSEADIVARVTVHTVRTDTDLDRRTTYRLLVNEDQAYLGSLPADIQLTTDEAAPGFGTVSGNERRILNQPFVLFLKWERPLDAAAALPRWHLSPSTEPVVLRTEFLLERRRGRRRSQPTRRVHIHRN